MLNKNVFSEILLKWYHIHKRDLPWRNTRDAYVIWLSEVIMQQTRVKQGLPYFHRFVERFPTVRELADAPEVEVMRLWQGLGYYSRAKNLHACAKNIVQNWGGMFPENYDDLLKLEGVGKYTAAAIASFAFDKKVAVVDGNVYRVLARVFGLTEDISSPAGQRKFQEFAQQLLPFEHSADYNQAIMEFGALHCTPRLPLCESCGFAKFCYANQHEAHYQLPVKSKKVKITKRYFDFAVFRYENSLYLKRREERDIWHGLYDFYLIESDHVREEEVVTDEILGLYPVPNKTVVTHVSPVYKHILTHQHLFARFFLVDLSEQLNGSWAGMKRYSMEMVHNLPKPILINNYLSENIF